MNLEDEKYRQGLDDDIFVQNFNSRANMFITEGLKNNFIRDYFNLDLRDKILEEQYRNNVDKEKFMNLMNSTDENLLNRRKNTAIKFKPIFQALKEKLQGQTKTKITTAQIDADDVEALTKLIKEYITQFIMEAVENWLVNKMDSFYVSENLIVSVSSYGGKHYLSISPRMDFLKA